MPPPAGAGAPPNCGTEGAAPNCGTAAAAAGAAEPNVNDGAAAAGAAAAFGGVGTDKSCIRHIEASNAYSTDKAHQGGG